MAIKPKVCDECKGTGYWSNYPPPADYVLDMQDCCGVCSGTGFLPEYKPGDVVHLVHLGEVTLVREMTTSMEGWEVRKTDGSLAYVDYGDFDMTPEDWVEIRKAWRQLRGLPPEASQ